ncbi:substrate-binding domain-containing protein [Bifidobacterium sp. H6bp22N]|nr:substrate-binding domain-containing protein [Bifidobacterium sp. H6bp22N]
MAEMANVSISSVSRFLNGGYVSSANRKRIGDAVNRLHYRPSRIAQALASEINPSIAVIAIDSSQLGPTLMLGGIEQKAREKGLAVTICVPETNKVVDIRHTLNAALDQQPLGVLFMYPDMVDMRLHDIFPLDVPYVMITGEKADGFPDISLCDKDGGEIITRYLLSLGHETVYHVAVPVKSKTNRRMQGWAKALRDMGARVPEPIYSTWDPGEARDIGRALALKEDVTAVFAGNDELAIGVISGLRDMGKRVPEDVSVVGFDGHPLSGYWDPPLTTLRQNFAEAGRSSVDLLLRQINGREQEEDEMATDENNEDMRMDIHGKLIIRGSASKPH